jgi:hypothetical protein
MVREENKRQGFLTDELRGMAESTMEIVTTTVSSPLTKAAHDANGF